jgi:hypothetical protein
LDRCVILGIFTITQTIYDRLKSSFTIPRLCRLQEKTTKRGSNTIHHNSINSFQAIAPLTAHEKGVHFLGEHISLKNGTFCPLLATIQPLSKERVFLFSENEQKLLSMGRTFTANKPLPLNNSPKQLKFQLGIKPGK